MGQAQYATLEHCDTELYAATTASSKTNWVSRGSLIRYFVSMNRDDNVVSEIWVERNN